MRKRIQRRQPRQQPSQSAPTQPTQQPNFDELIEAARRLRYDGDPEHVKDRLWQIIVRGDKYVQRRADQGHSSAYDQMVVEDCAAIAAAIKLLTEKP